MKILRLILFFIFCINFPSFSQHKTDQRDTIIQVCNNNKVKIFENIRYGKKNVLDSIDGSSDRLLDLYLPNKDLKHLPVLLFIHGGGFKGGDKSTLGFIAEKIAARGIAVVNINYFLGLKKVSDVQASCTSNMSSGIPDHFHPELNKAIRLASDDAIKALRWIKKNKKKYRFDTSRISVSGGSAGAMTALYTAYKAPQQVVKIDKVVNLWGGMEDIKGIKKDSPPLLSYHGDQDTTINIDFAKTLANRMKQVQNDESRLIILKNKGHAQYRLIANDKIDEIVAFLNNSGS